MQEGSAGHTISSAFWSLGDHACTPPRIAEGRTMIGARWRQIASCTLLAFVGLTMGISVRNFSSFCTMCSFMPSVDRKALIGSLRNDTDLFSRYGIFLLERVKFGFLDFPVWPQMEMAAHSETLAFKWDQSSHRCVTWSIAWQFVLLLVVRQVSSAYCRIDIWSGGANRPEMVANMVTFWCKAVEVKVDDDTNDGRSQWVALKEAYGPVHWLGLPRSTRVLSGLNLVDTDWSAFNFYRS